MNETEVKFPNPPIVEAVLDINCDLPPGFDLEALEERARERLGDRYPKFRKRFMHELEIATKAEVPPKLSSQRSVQSLQFLYEDERQLVQIRSEGFSFNRLAPYASFDEYLPEIEWAWRLYGEIASPIETRNVRLRYINRIPLPLTAGKVDLDEYLTIGPRLTDETALELTGFLVQHTAIEKDTGHHVYLVLTSQASENGKLPVILDISVANPLRKEPSDWSAIRRLIHSLRSLKNRIFLNTLTDRCQQLFQ